ncbi:MAG TPA: short-chain dehydrogenase [Chitinophagaceae bacterium]|nr:short-chain dehydrogenase [Chitinophagaceae bacterium]
MTTEQIEKYIETEKRKNAAVFIHFKDRQPVEGVFIVGKDYDELKSKNLWRIVTETKYEQWKEKKDINLSRIFNGISFTRLSTES